MSEQHGKPGPVESGDSASVGEEDNTTDWERPETWPREIGGPKGPEPTRYGDWDVNGRCSDF